MLSPNAVLPSECPLRPPCYLFSPRRNAVAFPRLWLVKRCGLFARVMLMVSFWLSNRATFCGCRTQWRVSQPRHRAGVQLNLKWQAYHFLRREGKWHSIFPFSSPAFPFCLPPFPFPFLLWCWLVSWLSFPFGRLGCHKMCVEQRTTSGLVHPLFLFEIESLSLVCNSPIGWAGRPVSPRPPPSAEITEKYHHVQMFFPDSEDGSCEATTNVFA